MCSVGDDNIEDLESNKYIPSKEKITPFTKCNKCREADPIVVLRSKDKYCKECFLSGTTHKFKSLLGKHKLIRPKDRVLILHKCGHPSASLLHFVRTGLDLETHKKLRFEPVILFIEDYHFLSLKERQELVIKVENEANHFKIPIYLTSLKKLIQSGGNESSIVTKSDQLELQNDDKNIIEEFVSKQCDETNKNDFLDIAKRKFLIDIAKYLNCKFIFTPEISSDVASQLLTDISLGRGSHIVLNTAFCDDRDDSVKILRPLRLFDAKELALYNHLNNLEPVVHKKRLENPHKSIQQLMKNFVSDLQINYPATVTTILKTGDKLTVDKKNTKKCELCCAPVEEETTELTSAEATHFSHWISTHSQEEFNNLTCDNYCFSCRRFIL